MHARTLANRLPLVQVAIASILVSSILYPTVFSATCCASETTASKVVEDFTLPNIYGKKVSLSDFSDREVVVVVFLGVECPLVKLYGPRLTQLQKKYDEQFDQRVQLIGINSNRQDSLTEVAAYARLHELNFPMLKDVGNQVADQMGALRTPEAFVLDSNRTICYRGRIDNQYDVGFSRKRGIENNLSQAIDEVLAGKKVTNANTDAVGCHIGRVPSSTPTGSITFTKDIAPIFFDHCVSCHREGEIAPFTLTKYEDVIGWEDTILEVIEDNRMPPWPADPKHGSFSNDARLDQDERQTIESWVENGMPKGDLKDMPKFVKGWSIGQPDQIIKMREQPYPVPAEGVVDYQYFVVDPEWKEDKYITAAEARPSNRSVVHHILAYILAPEQNRPDLRRILVGYAPGSRPVQLDQGIAIHVPAGSKILFELHYTPNGTAQDDLSHIGLQFTSKESVRKHLQGRLAINHRFKIPPHEPEHEVIAHSFVKKDELLLSMTPHLHLRGSSFRYTARFPDGREETLLDVPRYDFNWQLKYILKEPLHLPAGTVIQCRATYDNSERNPLNPDPNKTVRWGDQSFDK